MRYASLTHAQSTTTLDDTEFVLPIIQANTYIALTGTTPHLIDNWSVVPDLQELMHREAGRAGSYIATSSYVEEPQDIYVRRHASNGTKIRMRPCTLAELDQSNRAGPLGRLSPPPLYAGIVHARHHPDRRSYLLGRLARRHRLG